MIASVFASHDTMVPRERVWQRYQAQTSIIGFGNLRGKRSAILGSLNFPDRVSWQHPDEFDESVISGYVEGQDIGKTPEHSHRSAQLFFCLEGLLTVMADNAIWMVPPSHAVWIPGQMVHAAQSVGAIKAGSVFVSHGVGANFWRHPRSIIVRPLLRELLIRFAKDRTDDIKQEARLASVILDELKSATDAATRMPIPRDRRLRRIVERLLHDPATAMTLEEWGKLVGASSRTLGRLFQAETGMSFVKWRSQLQASLAVTRLAQGIPVGMVAEELGFDSVSAFIAMFKRTVGTTPTGYLAAPVQ